MGRSDGTFDGTFAPVDNADPLFTQAVYARDTDFLAPDLRLVYGHQRVSLDDAWRTHSTIYGKSWAGTTVGTDQRRVFDQGRALDYLQLHAENRPGFAAL